MNILSWWKTCIANCMVFLFFVISVTPPVMAASGTMAREIKNKYVLPLRILWSLVACCLWCGVIAAAENAYAQEENRADATEAFDILFSHLDRKIVKYNGHNSPVIWQLLPVAFLIIISLSLAGSIAFAEENGEWKNYNHFRGVMEGRTTISGGWAEMNITGGVANAVYDQMSFPVMEGTSSMNTPGQSKGFPGLVCIKYHLPNAGHDAYECSALINLRKGTLVDAVFSNAEPQDDESEDRLTAWWDTQGNRSPRVPDIPEMVKDANSQEWSKTPIVRNGFLLKKLMRKMEIWKGLITFVGKLADRRQSRMDG